MDLGTLACWLTHQCLPRVVEFDLRYEGQKQERREDHQMHRALHHVGPAGAEGDRSDEKGQCHQDQVLRVESERKRNAEQHREERDRRDALTPKRSVARSQRKNATRMQRSAL